jgi:hypothetical protein
MIMIETGVVKALKRINLIQKKAAGGQRTPGWCLNMQRGGSASWPE